MTQCCYYCNLLLALAQPRKMDGREFSLLLLCMYIDVQMMMARRGAERCGVVHRATRRGDHQCILILKKIASLTYVPMLTI